MYKKRLESLGYNLNSFTILLFSFICQGVLCFIQIKDKISDVSLIRIPLTPFFSTIYLFSYSLNSIPIRSFLFCLEILGIKFITIIHPIFFIKTDIFD